MEGRRPAGYVVASRSSKAFDDPGIFVEIPLVNQIRPRVKAWREAGYPGVTSITKRLLEHWDDPNEFEARRFFFCQLEAIETLIWLTEAPAAERVGIEIPGDGGAFQRQCCKMATGSGKTIVMAMVIAWHILNKVAYPQDTRFSKNVLVMAPGLTVKSRLAVLDPLAPDNYYEAVSASCPGPAGQAAPGAGAGAQLAVLSWELPSSWPRSAQRGQARRQERRSLHPRGAGRDGERPQPAGDQRRGAPRLAREPGGRGQIPAQRDLKDSAEEATVWIGGLDRLHARAGILTCYDFSATPFYALGQEEQRGSAFGWIVSDFGLNDAIESGLVKTPRVVVRDDAVPDAKTYKSAPLPHLQRSGSQGRPEPQGRAAGAAARPGAERLLPAGLRLAGDVRRPGRSAGHAHPAGDDHRLQPHRDGGAGQVCL